MKKQHSVLLVAILPFLSLTGCGSGSHTAQNHHSASQSSAQKGEENMPTQSPMLNEIFAIKQKEVPRGQAIDVSHIVTKYIPLGTSKEQTRQLLKQMNQNYKEDGNIIHAGYFKQTYPFVPTPAALIELKFNQLDYLENINAEFHYVE